MRGGERDVDVARLLDRLAAVHGLSDGQGSRLLLNQPGDAEDVFGPLAGSELAPDLLVRATRLAHRAVDVFRVRLGDLRNRLFRRRIDRLEPALGVRLDEFAADEEVIARLKLDVIRRLERGGVMPFHQRATGCSGR